MTPLYFDNAKGGLTSRDGKLLECCCCEYCCGKFGAGGQNNPTILTASTYQGADPNNGTFTIQYSAEEPSCPYPGFIGVLHSAYFIFVDLINSNPLTVGTINLYLYCATYGPLEDPPYFGSRNFILSSNSVLGVCESNNKTFVSGTTILSNGPCGDSFNAVFSCDSNGGKVTLWKV